MHARGLITSALVAIVSVASAAEPEVYATVKLGKDKEGNRESASAAQFSPDGKQLAFINSGRKTVLWDVAKKKEMTTFETKDLYRAMAWSLDGKSIYAADIRRLYRLDVATGERTELYRHDEIVEVVRTLPGTAYLASGGVDGRVKVWDVEKGKLVKEIKSPYGGLVIDLVALPDASQLIAVANAATPTRGEKGQEVIELRKLIFTAHLKEDRVRPAIDPAPIDDGHPLAAAHTTGEFAYADGDAVVVVSADSGRSRSIGGCPLCPLVCRFSASDRYLLVGGMSRLSIPFSEPGELAVYDRRARKWVANVMTGGRTVMDLDYSEPANLLTCTSGRAADRQITIWNMVGILEPAARPKEKK